MSEQVNELLPEIVPAPDAPADGAVLSAASEEVATSVDSAVPEEVETAQKIADEAAEEKTEKAVEATVEAALTEAAEEAESSRTSADTSIDPFSAPAEEPGEPSLGVPHKARRTSKVDEILAAAKDVALQGVREITPDHNIGLVHHVRPEEERLSTHLFECTMPGYRGWFWFATLSRAPRSKVATICEVGLLPGDDALIAPDWVPWADRVRPEDLEQESSADSSEANAEEKVEEKTEEPEASAEASEESTAENGVESAEATGVSEESEVSEALAAE
ncbi:DUF3027 domain-containing protein [Rothia mucilaginosa]|uniref:DUF3027 domain-containing protein n=1 Tax=Rothia mucilaginosa TaxID=43675 RepID=UPI0026ECE74C|nr:DUF3027 domain-containing protein [Rothia mucilaginosa]